MIRRVLRRLRNGWCLLVHGQHLAFDHYLDYPGRRRASVYCLRPGCRRRGTVLTLAKLEIA